jgi:hypothetical protein
MRTGTEIVCLLVKVEEQATGSLRGYNRYVDTKQINPDEWYSSFLVPVPQM